MSATRDAMVHDKIVTALKLLVAGLEEMRTDPEWFDQYNSPLGKRAHLEAVRSGKLAGYRPPGTRSVFVERDELRKYMLANRIVDVRQPKPANDDHRDATDLVADVLAHRSKRRRRAG